MRPSNLIKFAVYLFVFGIFFQYVCIPTHIHSKDAEFPIASRINTMAPSLAVKTPRIPTTHITPIHTCSCGNWGRWNDKVGEYTIKCCRNHTVMASKDIMAFLKHNNVPFTVTGGTLLGAVRCGEFIAYDYDFDLELYGTEDNMRALINKWHRTSPIFKEMSITLGGKSWRKNKLVGSKMGDVHMDIGVVQKQEELVPCIFENANITCYKNYDMKLSNKYGQDWMTPRRWCDWSKSRLCKETDTSLENHCVKKRIEMYNHCKERPTLAIGKRGCLSTISGHQ